MITSYHNYIHPSYLFQNRGRTSSRASPVLKKVAQMYMITIMSYHNYKQLSFYFRTGEAQECNSIKAFAF